jgi:hypothetical protein
MRDPKLRRLDEETVAEGARRVATEELYDQLEDDETIPPPVRIRHATDAVLRLALTDLRAVMSPGSSESVADWIDRQLADIDPEKYPGYDPEK